MNNDKKMRIRHAKGPFAITVVYSFTGAAILASIIFSLLLFLSIDENPWMKVLFGSLAVIFELGKFFAWYEFGERLARRHFTAAFSAFTFYAVLAAISIGGSIGGINSATNTAQKHVDLQQSKVEAFNLQINALEKQIALNNVAAEKYIELNRIATGVARIQKENALLREQQVELAIQRDSLPVSSQGSVFGLIGSIADGFNIKAMDAQLGLVVFLSVLLDLFAAFFVGLIGEELRFTRTLAIREKLAEKTITDQQGSNSLTETEPQPSAEKLEETVSRPEVLFQKALDILLKGDVRCSKKAIADKLNIKGEEVDLIFSGLLEKGFVTQKANRHFIWQGESTLS
ncbi:Preprotein translocase subunit SecY [Psychromonas sp.]|uniref:Preprotein translocase subunit SecY n=1 Tax=Psychromonas sp. TaxID=1884585 RepID=UPI0035695897